MNIKENKRVTAIAVVFAAAFIGLCCYGYGGYTKLQEANALISSESSKLENYSMEDMPPTRENGQILTKAAASVEQMAAELRDDMKKYVDVSLKMGENMSPAGFQKNVNDMTAKIAAYAQEKGCALVGEAPGLGLNEYKTASAREKEVSYLNFTLHAVDRAVRHVIDAGAPSISRAFCGRLSEETVDRLTSARNKSPYVPLEVELSFTAKRSEVIDPANPDSFSVIPRVINKFTDDDQYFFIITGLSVKTAGNLTPVGPYKAPTAAAQGDSLMGSDEESAPSEPVARLITGRSDDMVNVSLTLQVLYFINKKS